MKEEPDSPDDFLEIILSLNKKHHIPRLVKPAGKR